MWPWVSQMPVGVMPVCSMALRMLATSPPGSMTTPSLVFVHHSSVQFCWNGVTGMMPARIGRFGCSVMGLV
jgi:hypothetical protein